MTNKIIITLKGIYPLLLECFYMFKKDFQRPNYNIQCLKYDLQLLQYETIKRFKTN